MGKYIADKKLREIVYDFDNIDLDLDNMVLEEEHIFSDEHNKKMDALFETWQKEEKNVNNKSKVIKFPKLSRTYKMVASVLIVLLIGISAFNSDAVLAYANKIKSFVIQQFEKYSIFEVDNETSHVDNIDFDSISLNYESDEFSIHNIKTLSLYKVYECSNKQGNFFDITVSKSADASTILVDTEGVNVNEKKIDNLVYQYVERHGIIQIYYFKNDILYNIETDLSLEKAFKEIKKID